MISTCTPPHCAKTLLVRAGLETNPGPLPTIHENEPPKKEYILASLCENAPDMEPGPKAFKKTSIRDCLRLYNISSDSNNTKSNKAKLNTVDRDILLATVNYLEGRDMSKFTKPAVINTLIERIDHHLPHACTICKSDYFIEQGVHSLLDCHKCGRGIHSTCLLKEIGHAAVHDSSITPTRHEIMELINPFNIPGWTYLCPCCNSKLIPSPEEGMYEKYKRKNTNADKQQSTDADSQHEVPPQKETEEVTQPPDESGGSAEVVVIDDTPPVFYDTAPCLVHAETGSSITRRRSWTHDSETQDSSVPSSSHQAKTQSNTDKEMPICRFYINNNCKHGMSGKGIPGTKCKFSHPRRCPKLITFGTGSKGCNKGRQCKFFHPRMCNNSLNTRYCPNLDCQFVHTKGTKRTDRSHEEKSQHNPQSEYADQNQHTMHNRQRHVITNTNDRDHFLGMLTDLKQELFQMMEQRLALHPLKLHHPNQPSFVPFQNPTHQHHQNHMIHPHTVQYPNAQTNHHQPQMIQQQNPIC